MAYQSLIKAIKTLYGYLDFDAIKQSSSAITALQTINKFIGR